MSRKLEQYSLDIVIPQPQNSESSQISETSQNSENTENDQVPTSDILAAFVIKNAQPVLMATGPILQRAQEITKMIIAEKGHLENEKLLIKCAQELAESAELLMISAEIVITKSEEDPEFKVISAARIVKASVSSLVAQLLVNGPDKEGIMNDHVKIVVHYTDAIIKMAETIVENTQAQKDQESPISGNIIKRKMNMTNILGQLRAQLAEEEANLKQFRKRF